MTVEPAVTVTTWDAPAGLLTRGTVVVLAGRGEPATLYERFGRRLASDAYTVRVLGDVAADLERSEATVRELLSASDPAAEKASVPRVLVGSDTGALLALRLAANDPDLVDGLVLAGLPTFDSTDSTTLAGAVGAAGAVEVDTEIVERTSCPTHRARLAADAGFVPGLLGAEGIPDRLRELRPEVVTVPVLGLHGAADRVSRLDAVRPVYAALGGPTHLVSVVDGKHDALNDITHRTAAATVVLFLERLRLGSSLPEIARDEPLERVAVAVAAAVAVATARP